MNDLVKALENFINTAKANTAFSGKAISSKWKECVELVDDGWKVINYSEIENSTDMLLRWAKRDKTFETRMSLSNQVQWLEYLETHKKEKFHVK